jgi:nucleoside-diphosphate-sugar epimerase
MRTREQRVLITGAAGFLGANLTQRLIASGHSVHVLLRPGSATWRLNGWQGRYTIHEADLRDGPAVTRAVARARPEVLYHLAAHGTKHAQNDQADILAINVMGTANLLHALDDRDDWALVHAGSSSEYGHKDGPITEEDRLEPRNAYGVAKTAATLLCQAAAARGRHVTTVRVFSAYGPLEEPTRLISYVMGCCLRSESPRVTSGWQPRDFVYVEDVLDLFELAASRPALRGQILHAATGRQRTVREVVAAVVAICSNGDVSTLYGATANRPDEPASWVASIERTTALTGWRPRYDLDDGIGHMWSLLRRGVAIPANT